MKNFIKKPKFIGDNILIAQTKELGNFYLCDVLLEYIYPRLFICENDNNRLFLLYEISSQENCDIWLVKEISGEERESLLNKKISLQESFQKDSSKNFLLVKTYGEEDKDEIIANAENSLEKLPKKPVFAD